MWALYARDGDAFRFDHFVTIAVLYCGTDQALDRPIRLCILHAMC